MPKRHYNGLDLGQRVDYSASVLIERKEMRQAQEKLPGTEEWEMEALTAVSLYEVRNVHRWDLGTAYADVVQDVFNALQHPELHTTTRLVVDATGVGVPVIEMMQRGPYRLNPQGIMITAGNSVGMGKDGMYNVSKRILITMLQTLVQSQRIRVSPKMEHYAELMREMKAFSLKLTAARNDTYEAWSEQDHDDIVMALAVAVWLAEHELGSETIYPAKRRRMNVGDDARDFLHW